MTNPTLSLSGREDVREIRPRDPRALLPAVLALVIAPLVSVREAAGMFGLLAFVCAWHVVVTGSVTVTGAALRRVAPFALAVVLLNAVFGPGAPMLSIGPMRLLSDRGLSNGVYFALRLSVMLMSASLLLAAVSPETLARGLYDVVRRVSRRAATGLALFVFLAMGFVPLVADEFQRIRLAQSFRGGDPAAVGWGTGFRRRAQAVRAALIPVVVSAVQRSGQLAMAVELRDVRHRLPSVILPPRFGGADAALLLSTAAAVVVASGWVT